MNRLYGGAVEALGDREIGVIAATSSIARDGHIVEVSGIDLSRYCANPVVLGSTNNGRQLARVWRSASTETCGPPGLSSQIRASALMPINVVRL